MMTNQEIVSVYESMVLLTGQMVQAAEDSDWDRLVVLERECAAKVHMLRQQEPAQPLAGESRERKLDAIRRMLEDDRRIRDLTMPWMAKLSAMINSTGAERRLARAYGNA